MSTTESKPTPPRSTELAEQKEIDLDGCKAYPKDSGAPLSWCRQNRGGWCFDDNHKPCKWYKS